MQPYILEINANPSLNIEHELDAQAYFKSKKLSESMVSSVDLYVKAKVVGDAIRIVMNKVDN